MKNNGSSKFLGLEDRLQLLRDVHGGDISVTLLVQKGEHPVIMQSSLAFNVGQDLSEEASVNIVPLKKSDRRVSSMKKEASKSRDGGFPDYVG